MHERESKQADFGWLVEHSLEISDKYAGRWIAVHGGRVIGIGGTAVEAADQARKVCNDGEFVLEAVEADADAIYAQL